MRTCEFTNRDGTARAGRLRIEEDEYLLPGVYETTGIFPALMQRHLDAVFPDDEPAFVHRYLTRDGEQPVLVHIHHEDESPFSPNPWAVRWHFCKW